MIYNKKKKLEKHLIKHLENYIINKFKKFQL